MTTKRQRRFFFFILSILFLPWQPPAIGDSAPSERVVLEHGRFSIAVPSGARFFPPDQLLGPDWNMICRRTERGRYDTVAGELEKKLAFDRVLSRTIKESQYHALVSKEPISFSTGTDGIRCIFGHHADAVYRLSYLFLNRRKDLVEIDIRFSTTLVQALKDASDDKEVAGIE